MRNKNLVFKTPVVMNWMFALIVLFSIWTTGVSAQSSGLVAANQITRSQFLAMNEAQQIAVLNDLGNYQITDLVNGTGAYLQDRVGGVIYLSVADFNNASGERKMHILKNPSNYIVVSDANLIPKTKISQEEFNALPAEKRNALLQSGDFEVIH